MADNANEMNDDLANSFLVFEPVAWNKSVRAILETYPMLISEVMEALDQTTLQLLRNMYPPLEQMIAENPYLGSEPNNDFNRISEFSAGGWNEAIWAHLGPYPMFLSEIIQALDPIELQRLQQRYPPMKQAIAENPHLGGEAL